MSNQHLVFYDAQCPLCQSLKNALQFFDTCERLNWVPVQEVSAATRAKAQRFADMEQQIYVVTTDDQLHIGYSAIRAILKALPFLTWIAFLMRPRWIEYVGQPVYEYVSARRHQWFGKKPYIRPKIS